MIHSHNRVVIRVDQSRLLCYVLHFVILDVEHPVREQILIHLVLEHIYCESCQLILLIRVGALLLSVFTGRFGINWLRFGHWNSHFLLKYNLIGKESDPVLEIGHYAVCGSP